MNLPEIVCNRRKFADNKIINLKAEQVCPGRSLERRLRDIELDRIKVKVKLDRETDELRLALLALDKKKKRSLAEDDRPHSVHGEKSLDYEHGLPPPEGSVVGAAGRLSARYQRPSYRELRQRDPSARARVNLVSYQRLITDLRLQEEQRKIRQAEFLRSMSTIETSVNTRKKVREREKSRISSSAPPSGSTFSHPAHWNSDVKHNNEAPASIQNHLPRSWHATDSGQLPESPSAAIHTSVRPLSTKTDYSQRVERDRHVYARDDHGPMGRRMATMTRRKSFPQSPNCSSGYKPSTSKTQDTDADMKSSKRSVKPRQANRTVLHVHVPQGNADNSPQILDNSPTNIPVTTKFSSVKPNVQFVYPDQTDPFNPDNGNDTKYLSEAKAKVKAEAEAKPTKRVSFRLDKVQRWVDEMPEDTLALESRSVSSATFQGSSSSSRRRPSTALNDSSPSQRKHSDDSTVEERTDSEHPVFYDIDEMTDTDYVWSEVRKCRYIRGYDPPELKIPEDVNLEDFVFAQTSDDGDFDSTATEDSNSVGNVEDFGK